MASRQVAGSFHSSTTRTTIGYYVYLPDAYRLHPHSPFPLLVFLHGSGERGNGTSELSKVLKWGPPRLIRDGRDFPMIIVTPQLPLSKKEWPVGLLGEVIETTRAAFAIDSTRTYLTGLSTGADGAWAYAIARPAEIAAIVSIAGAGDPAKVCGMRDVPVWAFHGQQDKDDPLDEEQRMVTALNACSPPPRRPARLTVYPRAGHEVWSRTYDGSAGYDIYSWLLENHR
jgi:predicted peptidase